MVPMDSNNIVAPNNTSSCFMFSLCIKGCNRIDPRSQPGAALRNDQTEGLVTPFPHTSTSWAVSEASYVTWSVQGFDVNHPNSSHWLQLPCATCFFGGWNSTTSKPPTKMAVWLTVNWFSVSGSPSSAAILRSISTGKACHGAWELSSLTPPQIL